MRFVNVIVVLLFLLSVVIFGTAQMQEWQNNSGTAPVITSSIDELEVTCDFTDTDLVEGLAAYDAEDGDLSSQILVGDISRFIDKGVSNVTYVVFDSSNQSETLTRKVHFTDYTPPRITLEKPLVFLIGDASSQNLLDYVGATDMLDGDLTDMLVQTDSNVNYLQVGTYYGTLEVSNSYGDTVSIELPVHIKNGDTELTIELSSNIVYLHTGEAFNPDEWVARVYNEEGVSLSTEIVEATSYVNTSTEGCYEVWYQASDLREGTGETWLTVVVQD